MALPFIKTNRKELDAFLRTGKNINDIGMVVGQVTGKPKYPKGHVGSKSRDRKRVAADHLSPKESARRARIRGLSAQLKGMDREQRKVARKQMVAMLKGEKVKFRGLGRTGRAPATAVARVAGVMASRGQYHLRALRAGQVVIKASNEQIRKALLGHGGKPADGLVTMGKGLKEEIRKAFRATGHSDTGRLIRNIQYQIFSIGGKKAVAQKRKDAAKLAKESKKRKRR